MPASISTPPANGFTAATGLPRRNRQRSGAAAHSASQARCNGATIWP
jgi:hypothetical protein